MNAPCLARRKSRSGFALIIVIAVVVLIVALLLGFLTQVTSERQASTAYKASATVRALANNVTSLVETQINLATTQGVNVAWSSQPGMVRTFDSTGNSKQAFKLYSASTLILGTDTQSLTATALNSDLIANDMPPTNWAGNAALWTDLNSPVTSNGGSYNYPILDNGTGPGQTQQVAPLGFSVTAAPGATTIQPVPMPVRWLYLLKDGTMVAPTAGTNANTVNVAGDKTNNPITGRIAFWTDDDSCKVNINTAAEGTFWDTPRANTTTDQYLADRQPAQKEYQRYAGHPAMTSLSAVFQSPSGPMFSSAPATAADIIYGLVPRISTGGSNEGGTPTYSVTSITPDSDRLYNSVDELIFNSSRSSNASLTRDQLEQAKFFLTAHSRAPEINLYNLPRIACWPEYVLTSTGVYDATHTTLFDNLIADCSTVNGLPYYFQRQKYNDPTNDIGLTNAVLGSRTNVKRNQELYSYLQYLTSTAVPGFGGDFKTKYGTDRDQILTEIFDYIRSANLYDANLVAGNQFTPASGTPGHGWVVPTAYTPSGTATMGFGRSYTLSEFGIGFICNADGNDTTGSNNPTATESKPIANRVLKGTALAAGEKIIQAIIVLEFFSPMHGWTGMQPDMQVEISGLEQLSITDSAAHVINLGFPADTAANPVIVGYNADPFLISGGRGSGGNPLWRYGVFSMASPTFGITTTADATSSYIHNYLFLGTPVTISSSTGQMVFSGASNDIVVKIYAGANTTVRNASNLIQTVNIKLPASSSTFPIPNLVTTAPGDGYTSAQNWWSFPKVQGWVTTTAYNATTHVATGTTSYVGRFANVNRAAYSGAHAGVGSGAFFNSAFDVVRTLLPAHGDYRLVAGQANVPNTVFQKHRFYDTTTTLMASNLANPSDPTAEQGYDQGGLYFPTRMSWSTGFDLPGNVAATDTPEATGDFDSALPGITDGPFINKPDEGNTYRAANDSAHIPYFVNSSTQIDPPSTFFTPNRIMPSSGMLGSLPTAVLKGTPWQTLLFRPQTGHVGANSPKDHLWMDLFWMPVVEPYAISDRFSTAGKINMNYQMVPFGTYIKRNTALQALFKSEKVTAIANGTGSTTSTYTKSKGGTTATNPDIRFTIDADKTLTQFDNKFTNSGGSNFYDVFKSPSEICDQHIVPTGSTLANMQDTSSTGFWPTHTGTGDNERERIYTTLYPRLTTKSNTYTVHFRVQTLQKLNGSTEGIWTEGKDLISAEYRGSSTIERYIDSNNSSIPDYASEAVAGTLATETKTLDTFYKWRVIANRQFAP